METNTTKSISRATPFSNVAIWLLVLLVSDLPDIIWHVLTGITPAWLFWIKCGILLILIISGSVLKRMRSYRILFILLLLLIAGLKAINWVRKTPGYIEWAQQAGWIPTMAASQAMRLLLVAAMVLSLLITGKRRKGFFLAKGDLKRWKRLGIILGFSIMILTFFFFQLHIPSTTALVKALPLIPAAVLFGASNAFNEEMQFRATLLSSLQTVSRLQSIMITSVLFGLAHYFGGSPPGVEGVLVTAALGWLFATCMLDTRGILMPWFMHFLSNAVTFSFLAMGLYSW